MPAIAHSTQAAKRATFAKTLARLSLALSVTSGFFVSQGEAFGQKCDRCDSRQVGMVDPSCGCELTVPSVMCNKKCTPHCVPKPSFAEKFLKRLDELGDNLEARSMQSRPRCNSTQVRSQCECALASAPSCGCESLSIPTASPMWQESGSKSKADYAFPDDPNKHAIGSLGDQHFVPRSIETPFAPSKDSARAGTPEETAPASKSIGLRSLPTPPDGLPGDERVPFIPVPSDALPGLDKSTLPDVLVDPFQDDVSASRMIRKRGVSLTSDVQSTKSQAVVRGKKPLDQDSVVSQADAPAKLTAEQRAVPVMPSDAAKRVAPKSNREPLVVSSSFWDPSPVVSSPRREVRSADQDSAPHVPRMLVPQKR